MVSQISFFFLIEPANFRRPVPLQFGGRAAGVSGRPGRRRQAGGRRTARRRQTNRSGREKAALNGHSLPQKTDGHRPSHQHPIKKLSGNKSSRSRSKRTGAGAAIYLYFLFVFSRQHNTLGRALQYFMASFLPGVARSADPPMARPTDPPNLQI